MKRAPKLWQMLSREIEVFRMDLARERTRDVSLGFALVYLLRSGCAPTELTLRVVLWAFPFR
jgi:hypothetical protein